MADDAELRVLVIDDDPHAFQMVRHMMASIAEPAFSIAWLGTYKEGIAALIENKYDVYLVDYLLGDEGGVDLLTYANDHNLDAPMILLTAYGNYEIDVQAMRLGAMDFLDKKRLTPELLERSIRYAVERKSTEKKLKKLHRQVAGLEQLKTEMIRITAHDLKNPLSSMRFSVSTMRRAIEHGDLEKLKQLADTIENNTNRMSNLVTDVLSLERIEALHENTLQRIEFNPVVASIENKFAEQVNTADLTLDFQTTDEALYIYGDEALLSQALDNLVSNAIKYTPAGGSIIIELQKEGCKALVRVTDTGTGIAEQHYGMLFEPFAKLGIEIDGKKVEGTGLGLYLVKNIIARHDGEIIFQSTPGQGSTFGFYLPLWPTQL